MAVEKPEANNQRRDIYLALLAFCIAFVLWQVQGLAFLTYPLRLFVTMIHELGHGTSAVATGGKFLGFEVKAGGAGLARTAGGSRFVIIQAGYLGTALFGAVLLYLTNRTKNPGRVAIGVGILIGILTFFYSGIRLVNLGPVEAVIVAAVIGAAFYLILTRETDEGRYLGGGVAVLSVLLIAAFSGWNNMLTVIVGLSSALLLIVIGFRADRDVVLVVLNFLAFMTGLQAMTDAWILFKIVSLPRSMMPLNDASSMARDIGGPATFWALLWIVLDMLIFGIAVYYTLIKPMRER